MSQTNEVKSDIFFSRLIALLPLLGSYSLPVYSRLDLATISIALYAIISFQRILRVRIKPILLLVVFVFVSTILSAAIRGSGIKTNYIVEETIVWFRVVKFVLLMLIVFLPDNKWGFDLATCMQTVKWVVRVTCGMLLLQQISYHLLHVVITNPLLSILTISGGVLWKKGTTFFQTDCIARQHSSWNHLGQQYIPQFT